VILDMQNVPRDTELNYCGENLKGAGPQHETLLMCITFIAGNFSKVCILLFTLSILVASLWLCVRDKAKSISKIQTFP
jgi:hypothetical protein